MVWIILLFCLGLVAAAGYYQGPIRAGFAFLGLVFGTMLAGPLSPLTQRLLSLLGLHHPAWNIFAPQVLAFLIVLTIFKIAGQVVHQKVAVFFKYKVDDKTLYRWQRVYARLGACVGVLNGAFYFILLMLLIYSAGYFTTLTASGDSDPGSARFLTDTRAGICNLKLDKVLATYDMVTPNVYEAADAASLVLHNPLLISRLEHYPPCLILAEHGEFKDLGHDVQFQQMIATQTKVSDILDYPKIHAMMTNAAIVSGVRSVLADDLDDLTNYLATGQSPKYDPETVLGIWNINRAATVDQVRKRQPGITPTKLRQKVAELFPMSLGLSLTAMPDHQVILKRPSPNNGEITPVATGTWRKDGDTYKINLPGSLPEDFKVEFEKDNRMFIPRIENGTEYYLGFDKEL